MTTQLRIYTIKRGNLQLFATEWKEMVLPLRLEHGFRISGAWIIEESNQFVWLVSYDGQETWEAKEDAYYSSLDRKNMDPNPARLISREEEYFVSDIL